MYYSPPHKIEWTSECERTLQNLAASREPPGTVIQDFEALLAFIQERSLPVTKRHQLPLKALPEINARLSYPIQLALNRPLQKSYPNVNGLYLLARASGLTALEGPPQKPLLVVDKITLSGWQALNQTERYCTLLETWLLRAHAEIIGEGRRGIVGTPDTFRQWLQFFTLIPDDGLHFAGNQNADWAVRYSLGWHNLALLHLFGLASVESAPPEPGQGWNVTRVSRTPLGDALLALLGSDFFSFENIWQLDEGKLLPGAMQPVLQPYLSDWKNNLSVPESVFRDGTYIFKVALGQVWRRIAIQANDTMDSLAYAILESVEFDSDHLYLFAYENRYGAQEELHHDYMDEGPWAVDEQVGNVPLRIGQTMIFLFDFGDNWKFDVMLERIDPPDEKKKKPVILEEHGEPPEQYPSWDE